MPAIQDSSYFSNGKYSASAGSDDKAKFTEFLLSQGLPFVRNRTIIDGCSRNSKNVSARCVESASIFCDF
ncbi:MAG: hypothetical protein C0469_00310 [Cyanobacteria bacterium DS2.3.42]|nr:hypothetical protein [Cyanobacteria bacterium DS2.3.42]